MSYYKTTLIQLTLSDAFDDIVESISFKWIIWLEK